MKPKDSVHDYTFGRWNIYLDISGILSLDEKLK